MTILDTDVQALIMRKVGDIDPVTGDPLEYGVVSIAGVVGASIGQLWASHADKAQITPRLRELFVERDAYDLVLGALSALVDVTLEGETVHLSQRIATLTHRRATVDTEILSLEKDAKHRRSASIGPITTVAPISPPTSPPVYVYGPDGNDPGYGGSPYRSLRRRWY